VLLRHAPDHFWFVQADGDLFPWLIAHAQDLDVAISDPGVFRQPSAGSAFAGGPRSRSRWGTVG
jgi:aminomethyltransferase